MGRHQGVEGRKIVVRAEAIPRPRILERCIVGRTFGAALEAQRQITVIIQVLHCTAHKSTIRVRNWVGLGNLSDTNSAWYTAGQVTGMHAGGLVPTPSGKAP